ncbi:MAG: AarF/ABC1/UbiB kinase family protein [Bdellovibrionota bacterium]|nr:AarF/ABC1/UbiB kinase family protein [Bdellovibrionota bacterium]
MRKIDKIKDGLFKRNTTLLKYALKTGKSIVTNRDNPAKIIEDLLGKDVSGFVDDLSHYKGSITKAGQILSQYAEYFLDEEMTKVLRNLQHSTHFLDFEKIKSQIPDHFFNELVIEESPLAAASIGQVHRAKIKESGEDIVLKIQYKGIDKAINGDLFFIKLLVKNLKIFPKGVDLSDFFEEIKKVLIGEMDYLREVDFQKKYQSKLDDPYFKTAKIYDKYCSEKVIALEYIEGSSISDLEVNESNQDTLNVLGEKLFENFLKEIFLYGLVQSDAHGANFIVPPLLDSLYLIDFGACLEYDHKTLEFYRQFLIHGYNRDREQFLKEFYSFWNSTNKSIKINEDLLWEYIILTTEPLHSENFDWGKTDLPDKAYPLAQKMMKSMKFKSAPSEMIFIDRKLIGLFTLLRKLECHFNVKQVFESVLTEYYQNQKLQNKK